MPTGKYKRFRKQIGQFARKKRLFQSLLMRAALGVVLTIKVKKVNE